MPSWAALRGRLGYYAAIAATWIVLGICLAPGPHNPTVGYATGRPVTAWQWLMTQAFVVVHYLQLSIWPQGLRGVYDSPIVKDFGASR